MKKLSILLLALLILALPLTASAKHHRGGHEHSREWENQVYYDKSWNRTHHESIPFNWHDRRDNFTSRYQMIRIHDNDWDNRFPGLRSYRWHDGDGFHYRGSNVRDAVFFYNDYDELVSIGFMHNGSFIFIRDDQSSYENHDSFFFSWWHR